MVCTTWVPGMFSVVVTIMACWEGGSLLEACIGISCSELSLDYQYDSSF
jgi:hypothetical protein